MTYALDVRSQMIACILDSIPLNVGCFILLDMWYFKLKCGFLVLFPYFITDLYRRVGVEEYLRDTWVPLKIPIYPFKIWGEDAPGKSKKRNINLVKLIDEDTDSHSPSIIGTIEEILVEIMAIKELMAGYLWGRESLPSPVTPILLNPIMRNIWRT